MPQHASISRRTRRARGKPFRIAGILAGVGLLVASCGTNSGSGAPGGSAAQAPAVSPAASVGGTLTVWAKADHGMLMAGSVILVVPVLIVFILFQRWITEGIATTGLKG